MATQKIISPTYSPHPKQWEWHKIQTRFKAAITGAGFGKSAMVINEEILDMTWPGRKGSPENPLIYVAVGPTYNMVRNTMMREFFKFCPHELIAFHNKAENKIGLINDTVLMFIAGDNEQDIDRMRGLTIGGAGLDEMALMPKYVWDVLLARLRDSRGSLRMYGASTPRGFNWVYDTFAMKKYGNKNDYALMGGSSLDNPFTPEEYKQTLIETYTGRFKEQEIFGKFVAHEGLVYADFNREIHVARTEKQWKQILAFVDWGYANPSVILVAGIDGDGNVHIMSEFYQSRVLQNDFESIAADMQREFKIERFIADPAEPGLIQSLRNRVVTVIEADNAIMEGITLVNSYLNAKPNPKLTVDPGCVNTIKEFESYCYPPKKDEKPQQEKPLKMMDHAMDALRYGLMHLKGKDKLEYLGANLL